MADPEKEKLKEERKLDVEEKNLEDALIIKPLDGRHFSYRLGVPFCVIPDQFSCYRPLIFRKKQEPSLILADLWRPSQVFPKFIILKHLPPSRVKDNMT